MAPIQMNNSPEAKQYCMSVLLGMTIFSKRLNTNNIHTKRIHPKK